MVLGDVDVIDHLETDTVHLLGPPKSGFYPGLLVLICRVLTCISLAFGFTCAFALVSSLFAPILLILSEHIYLTSIILIFLILKVLLVWIGCRK